MSDSFSSSSSNSSTYIPDYPQSGILMQIAQMAQNYANSMASWANNVYAQTSGIVDQTVSNYLASAQMANDFATHDLARYQQTFQPLENELIQDARTYASPERLRQDMGAAIAQQRQAGDASRIASENELKSFGIDPTEGRYQDLERASRLESAAAGVGAAQNARRADEQIGRGLRSEAIQVGQRYPGQVINALNTQAQALAGATNAALGRANTGANLQRLPNDYLRTAMELKYPPLGHNASSQSFSTRGGGTNSGGNKGQQGGGARGGGGGGGPGGNGDVGMAYDAARQRQPGGISNGYGGGYAGGQPNAGIINTGGGAYGDDYYNADANINYDPWGGWTDPTQEGIAWGPSYDQYDPSSYDFGGQWGDFSGNWDDAVNGADPSLWDSYYPQEANMGYDSYGSGGDYYSDPGTYYNNSYSGDSGYNDASYSSYDPGSYSSYDSGGWDTGGGGGGDYGFDYSSADWGDYARGGPVPQRGQRPQPGRGPTTGGFVPRGASPSAGRRTDDIPANLNAGEFVVPRDVVEWKGKEFFQGLIDKSRKARGQPAGPPAQGKPSKPAPGPIRFQSRPMQSPFG